MNDTISQLLLGRGTPNAELNNGIHALVSTTFLSRRHSTLNY